MSIPYDESTSNPNGSSPEPGENPSAEYLPEAVAQSAPDPFDPARLRMDQDFEAVVGVTKLLTTIHVRKPSKENFVRTHPDQDFWLRTGVIDLKEDREVYLVDPQLWADLATETTFSTKMLVFSVTRQGVPFIWPLRLPGTDGRLDEWGRSALEAANKAKDYWVRVQANMSLGAFEIQVASGMLAEPDFPQKSMGEILKIAFRDYYIDSLNHNVLRKLRGEL